jgi:uncharacterized protein YjbI with pentapeptide repeats
LSDTDLSGTILSQASLDSVDLTGSNITAEQLSEAAVVTGVNLAGMNLAGAVFSGVDFSSANLVGTDLSEADFHGAVLSNADLTGADLSGSELTVAQLSSAASLQSISLPGFNFSKADLSTWDLQGADLSGADFNGADLSYAVLSQTVLTGADFNNAILNSANLFHAEGFTVGMMESAARTTNAQFQPPEEFFEQAGLVCFGNPISQAFEGREGYHPALVLHDQDYYTISPSDHPLWIDYIEIIACASTYENLVQTCGNYYYTDTGEAAPDIDRIRYEVTVNVYYAKTGELLATQEFKGTDPRYCQQSEEGWTTEIYGDPVDTQTVVDWVLQFITEAFP